MSTAAPKIEDFLSRKYDAGFVTDIESDTIRIGLDEDVIRLIMEATGYERHEIEPDMDIRQDLSIRSSRLLLPSAPSTAAASTTSSRTKSSSSLRSAPTAMRCASSCSTAFGRSPSTHAARWAAPRSRS